MMLEYCKSPRCNQKRQLPDSVRVACAVMSDDYGPNMIQAEPEAIEARFYMTPKHNGDW